MGSKVERPNVELTERRNKNKLFRELNRTFLVTKVSLPDGAPGQMKARSKSSKIQKSWARTQKGFVP